MLELTSARSRSRLRPSGPGERRFEAPGKRFRFPGHSRSAPEPHLTARKPRFGADRVRLDTAHHRFVLDSPFLMLTTLGHMGRMLQK